MAQQLKFHVDCAEDTCMSMLERQTRIRIWAALFEFDKYSCIVSGLPFMINSKICFPLSEKIWISLGSDEEITNNTEKSVSTGFFGSLIELLEITARIRSLVCLNNENSNFAPLSHDAIDKLDVELLAWHAKLLPSINTSKEQDSESVFGSDFMICLYHFSRIILFSEVDYLGDELKAKYEKNSIRSSHEILRFSERMSSNGDVYQVPPFISRCILAAGKVFNKDAKGGFSDETKNCLLLLNNLSGIYAPARHDYASLMSWVSTACHEMEH